MHGLWFSTKFDRIVRRKFKRQLAIVSSINTHASTMDIHHISFNLYIQTWRYYYSLFVFTLRYNYSHSFPFQTNPITNMENSILSNNQNQSPLPNATTSLVLGILSLVFCVFYGIVGFVLGIIGLVLANKDRKLYQLNPELFTKSSYNNSNAGRTCSIIGVILSSIFLLFILGIIVFLGTNAEFLDAFKHLK